MKPDLRTFRSPEMEQRDAQIIAQYRSGLTVHQVAKLHGLTGQRVSQILRRDGVERVYNGRHHRPPICDMVLDRAAGMRVREIAAKHGVNTATLHSRLMNLGLTDRNIVPVRSFTQSQLEAYRQAVDVDRLSHPDALEIAAEYRGEEAA